MVAVGDQQRPASRGRRRPRRRSRARARAGSACRRRPRSRPPAPARTAGLEELLGAAVRVAVQDEDRRQVRPRRAQQPQPARDRAATRPLVPAHHARVVRLEPHQADEARARTAACRRASTSPARRGRSRARGRDQHALCAPVADQRVDVRLVAVVGQDQPHHVVVAAPEQPRALRRLDDVERRRDDIGDATRAGSKCSARNGRTRSCASRGHPRIVPAAAAVVPGAVPYTRPWRRRRRSGFATSSRASSSTRRSRCCARTAAGRAPATRSCRSTWATGPAASARWCSTTSPCSTPASRGRHGARARHGGGVPRPSAARGPEHRADRAGRRRSPTSRAPAATPTTSTGSPTSWPASSTTRRCAGSSRPSTPTPRFRSRFREAPMSIEGHHAYAGGALQHTIAVATICREVSSSSRAWTSPCSRRRRSPSRSAPPTPSRPVRRCSSARRAGCSASRTSRCAASSARRTVCARRASALLPLLHCIAGGRPRTPEAPALQAATALDAARRRGAARFGP